jgi:tRNA (guanosine-2'-O-)-methyltransferase
MISKERLQKIKSVAGRRQEGVVVLEDIYDPHNAAAVLRSCEGFGIQKVYFIFDRGEKFNPRRVGKATSSSANKWLEFETFTSAKECYKKLKKQGFKIFATVLDHKAKSIFKTNLKGPKTALVFGNEHRGLSQEAIDLADAHIYIPMQGFVQSFNLSVTVAVCMYELFRQRQSQPKKYLLSKKDQVKLINSWKKK